MSAGDREGCLLHAVHQRLEDLHRQWHAAADAYFDPDGFRVAIQTAIQTARTVTFILQSNKNVIPNFDIWYGLPNKDGVKNPANSAECWQERLAAIPLMRWMVDARNKIEKRGDLELHSMVHAEIVASYFEGGAAIQVPASLWDAPLALVRSIPNDLAGAHVKKDGFVRIQRRWIENTLPDCELLEAVAVAYGHLAELLSDAHRVIGLKETEITDISTGEMYDPKSMHGRLPCMVGHADARTLDVWLRNGARVELQTRKLKLDPDALPRLEGHYGIKPEEIFGDSGTVSGTLDSLFATATRMFLKDGHHDTIVFLLKNGRPVRIIKLVPEEHGEKYLLMRKMAQEVTTKGADGVIMLGEVWAAPFDQANPYGRAAESDKKREALVATAVSKEGVARQLASFVKRDGDVISLEAPIEELDGTHYMFVPIYEAWGKAIPSHWASGTADSVRERPD